MSLSFENSLFNVRARNEEPEEWACSKKALQPLDSMKYPKRERFNNVTDFIAVIVHKNPSWPGYCHQFQETLSWKSVHWTSGIAHASHLQWCLSRMRIGAIFGPEKCQFWSSLEHLNMHFGAPWSNYMHTAKDLEILNTRLTIPNSTLTCSKAVLQCL